jgi:hypothetical protein
MLSNSINEFWEPYSLIKGVSNKNIIYNTKIIVKANQFQGFNENIENSLTVKAEMLEIKRNDTSLNIKVSAKLIKRVA